MTNGEKAFRWEQEGLLFAFALLAFLVTVLTARSVAALPLVPDAETLERGYAHTVPWRSLYLLPMLFSAAATTMLLAPGVFFALGLGGRPRSWANVVATGFVVAFVARSSLHALLKVLLVTPLTAEAFWGGEVVLLLTSIGWLLARRARRDVPQPTGWAGLPILLPLIPAVAIALLGPWVFWQTLNQDGFEALEVGRSLLHHVMPRAMGGEYWGLGSGIVSMAYPVSWFIHMLGPSEAASRLPLLLYLPVLAITLVGLGEAGRHARIGASGLSVVLLVLTGYVAVMAFNGSYSPYSADIGSPTAFETLTVTCLAGILLGLWEGRPGTFFGFVLLGAFARPTVPLFIAFLLIGTLLGSSGAERKRMLRYLGAGLATYVASVVLYEELLLKLVIKSPYTADPSSLLGRYRYLSFTDIRRLIWVAIPAGILPFASLLALRWQDVYARQLSIALGLFAAAFFLPAFVALHHFVPLMILPVAVFLRISTECPGWIRSAGVICCMLAVLISWPRDTRLETTQRALGERIAFIPGPTGEPGERRLLMRSASLARHFFPLQRDVADPSETLVGAPHAYLHYSQRSGVTLAEADYAILAGSALKPAGFTEIARDEQFAAYVRDVDAWQDDRMSPPPTTFGNPLFRVPRESLFWFIGVPRQAYDLDLASLPGLWRLF